MLDVIVGAKLSSIQLAAFICRPVLESLKLNGRCGLFTIGISAICEDIDCAKAVPYVVLGLFCFHGLSFCFFPIFGVVNPLLVFTYLSVDCIYFPLFKLDLRALEWVSGFSRASSSKRLSLC